MLEVECGQLANIRFTWPGKAEQLVCIDCAKKVQNVALAIGLPLQLLPIGGHEVRDPLDWPTCTCKVQGEEE